MDGSFLGGGKKGHCRSEKLQSGWRNWKPEPTKSTRTIHFHHNFVDGRWTWTMLEPVQWAKKENKMAAQHYWLTNKNSFAACDWGTRGGKKQYSKRKKTVASRNLHGQTRKNLTASGAHHYVYVHGYTQNIQCAGIFTGNLFLAQRRVRAAPKKAWRERINLGDDKGKTSERASP